MTQQVGFWVLIVSAQIFTVLAFAWYFDRRDARRHIEAQKSARRNTLFLEEKESWRQIDIDKIQQIESLRAENAELQSRLAQANRILESTPATQCRGKLKAV